MGNKALLVTKKTSAADILKQLLTDNSYTVGAVVSKADAALHMANDPIYDVVVINAPIEDESGIELSMRISRDTVCGVVLLVQDNKAGAVGRKVADYGVAVVPKPINKMLFRQSLNMVRAAVKRYAYLSAENEKLKSRLEETKIINRAKFLLMQYLSLSEDRAHKYIEKQAMDMRISKAEAARRILITYGK